MADCGLEKDQPATNDISSAQAASKFISTGESADMFWPGIKFGGNGALFAASTLNFKQAAFNPKLPAWEIHLDSFFASPPGANPTAAGSAW
jgi:GMP synthase-like glutamine amidotransferase